MEIKSYFNIKDNETNYKEFYDKLCLLCEKYGYSQWLIGVADPLTQTESEFSFGGKFSEGMRDGMEEYIEILKEK